MNIADRDAQSVAAQIGRPPRGMWQVARRCACGLPQVIQTSPRLEDGTPFPTLWWLTCRALSAEIGRLESGGWMAGLNERLKTDERMRADLARSTKNYVARRDSLGPLGQAGHPGGGPDHVKCLHAHTAHHLITGDNPVGRAVLAELGWREPARPCI